jgi:hypothetical protein
MNIHSILSSRELRGFHGGERGGLFCAALKDIDVALRAENAPFRGCGHWQSLNWGSLPRCEDGELLLGSGGSHQCRRHLLRRRRHYRAGA